MRKIKQLLAYGLNMREMYSYAFFDESFLQSIDWQPGKTLRVQQAVSENWQQLVTTLIPNILKAVSIHAHELDQMSFFEWGRMWPEASDVEEQSSLAGIFVNQKGFVNFYDGKQQLESLASLLGIKFDWIKADEKELAPWYLPYQTAYLMYEGKKIGTAGTADPTFFTKIANGQAFIFELDATILLNLIVPLKRYTAASKYPHITRDVSLLIPLGVTVRALSDALKKIDDKINHVELLDFFEKPEWKDQKSVTFRIIMVDSHTTMTTAQADAIMAEVTSYLQKQGATIR